MYCYLCYHYAVFLDEYVVLEHDDTLVDPKTMSHEKQCYLDRDMPRDTLKQARGFYLDKLLLSYGLPDSGVLSERLEDADTMLDATQKESIKTILRDSTKIAERAVFAQVVACCFVPWESNALERQKRDCFHVIAFYFDKCVVQVTMAVEYAWL